MTAAKTPPRAPRANPEQPTPAPPQEQKIPWKFILITSAFSSLGALVIGDFYRAAKSRFANIGASPSIPPHMPGQVPGQMHVPAVEAPRMPNPPDQRWSLPGDDTPYREENPVEEEDMWDRDEIEDKLRKLNRRERELQAREAEINEKARKLRLIS